jgi:hypothetical protein
LNTEVKGLLERRVVGDPQRASNIQKTARAAGERVSKGAGGKLHSRDAPIVGQIRGGKTIGAVIAEDNKVGRTR